ncbi:pimeloyl-ACP methyl ester carboxylesterase [Saccharothrix carnea]|uniref:Pimeloyl-ACP methyl ester carboxylesterase n=1 Tax=Saccharothrix carnea TaxID=1280637 RepID=A0A2P8I638_SACCR|nr:epoxide hydrolase family protein [Saccharothrix carnea]PSL53934.1 pimeloyl-ACP methyl ester carboxylesterase [Saccharothrix carnea]
MIKPFQLEVPQSELHDLADRLTRTRWPEELPDAEFDYGFPLAEVRALADRWLDGYDWRRHEAELNEFPQFTTEIDGQRVHFLHVRSARADALPLVLIHGWPGSVLEFLDVIEPLSRDFHLVIPSIPGFGLSGPTTSRGWDVDRVARAFAELMGRLGYRRYGTQGGDWGAGIAKAMAVAAPENVVAVHVNYLPTPPVEGIELSEEDSQRLEKIKGMMRSRPGYQVLQGTRPQTISYALTDSPVGQLAWIAEKFTEWTDPASKIDVDRILTNVMLYWLTGTAGSSARLTRETGIRSDGCPAPLGVAVFAHDIVLSVRPLAELTYRVEHWSEFDRGGHFAAMEVPELLAGDIKAFFADRA